jgi:hypothetical protein
MNNAKVIAVVGVETDAGGEVARLHADRAAAPGRTGRGAVHRLASCDAQRGSASASGSPRLCSAPADRWWRIQLNDGQLYTGNSPLGRYFRKITQIAGEHE